VRMGRSSLTANTLWARLIAVVLYSVVLIGLGCKTSDVR
jgi:hypothetical protein